VTARVLLEEVERAPTGVYEDPTGDELPTLTVATPAELVAADAAVTPTTSEVMVMARTKKRFTTTPVL
jgi:hypothetical protein